jgi:hypothetical protein
MQGAQGRDTDGDVDKALSWSGTGIAAPQRTQSRRPKQGAHIRSQWEKGKDWRDRIMPGSGLREQTA